VRHAVGRRALQVRPGQDVEVLPGALQYVTLHPKKLNPELEHTLRSLLARSSKNLGSALHACQYGEYCSSGDRQRVRA
jgi:hypothetical protein